MQRERLHEKPNTEQDQKRPGPGRPKSLTFMTAAQLRDWALRSGEMPHIFLLRVSRGETIDGHKPSFETRIEAARFCAPYLIPRLRLIELSDAERDPRPTEQLVFNEDVLETLSEAELAIFRKMFSKITGRVDPKPEPEAAQPNRYRRTLFPEDLEE
jgi:hypothetical protein